MDYHYHRKKSVDADIACSANTCILDTLRRLAAVNCCLPLLPSLVHLSGLYRYIRVCVCVCITVIGECKGRYESRQVHGRRRTSLHTSPWKHIARTENHVTLTEIDELSIF